METNEYEGDIEETPEGTPETDLPGPSDAEREAYEPVASRARVEPEPQDEEEGEDPDAEYEEEDDESAFEVPLDDVPEEYRHLITAKQASMRADYTRKTQAVAQQRQEAEEAIALQAALQSEDPQERQEALRHLLAQQDLEVEFPDDEDFGDENVELDEGEEPVDPDVAALQARLDAREALEAEAREEQEMAEYQEQVEEVVGQHLTAYAEHLGVEELPEAAVAGIVARTTLLDTTADGMPDIEQAIVDHEEMIREVEAQAIERYIAGKTQHAVPRANGSPASTRPDVPKGRDARLAAANAVVGRHV